MSSRKIVLALLCLLLPASAALQVNQLGGFGGRLSGYDAETKTWIARVDAAGGTYATNSKAIADALIVALKAKSYQAKIVYLLPLLGSNLAAARVPLRDSLAVGIATSTGFVDADFSQATGLQGNGTSKYLNSLIKPSQLGTSNRGGLGWWETNMVLTGNVEPIGCYWSTDAYQRFVLDLRSTPYKAFRWGYYTTNAQSNTTPANGHYYGQCSSTTDIRIYFGGSLLNTNTASNTITGAASMNIYIGGANESGTAAPWPGRCAVAYMTDGTLSDAEVADFHTLLSTYLITPTGR